MINILYRARYLILFLLLGMILPFRFTLTDSVKPRIFYITKFDSAKKGDFIVFKRDPSSDRVSKLSFIKETIKQVGGVPGDRVEEHKREYFVNGESMGVAKAFNSQGDHLLKGATGVIPRGYIYVRGTGENSLDSRYDAMGWVHESRVIARAIPIW